MSILSEVVMCLERSWQFDLGLVDFFKKAGYKLEILIVERGTNVDGARNKILNSSCPVIFMTPNPLIALGEHDFMKSLAATELPIVLYNADPPALTCHFIPEDMKNLATLLGSPKSEKFWRNYVNQGPSTFTQYQTITPAVEKKLIPYIQKSNKNKDIELFVPINYRWFGYTPEEFELVFSTIPKFFQNLIDAAVEKTFLGVDCTNAFEQELKNGNLSLDKIQYKQMLRYFTYRLNLTKRKRLFQILKRYPVLISSNIKPSFFDQGYCKARWIQTDLENSVDLFFNSACILTMPYIDDLIHDRVTTAFACGAVPFIERQNIIDLRDTLWSKIPSFTWSDSSLPEGLDDIFANSKKYISLGDELKEIASKREMCFSSEKLLSLLQLISDPYLSGSTLKSIQKRILQ
jgi:hypothetical protein